MAIGERMEGKRIFLLALDPERLSPAYISWMKDPEVLKYLAQPDGDYSVQNLKKFVSAMNASRQDYLFGIFLKENSQHIGNIKIGGIHPKHLFGDIGIIIGERLVWGKGYATEAIQLAGEYAFTKLKLHKLYAGMIEGNEGSLKAFLKVGFKRSGCYHRHCLIDGTYRDSYIVEIFNE